MIFKYNFFIVAFFIILLKFRIVFSQCSFGLTGKNCDIVDSRFVEIAYDIDLGWFLYSYSLTVSQQSCLQKCANDNYCFGSTYDKVSKLCFLYQKGDFMPSINSNYVSYIYYDVSGEISLNTYLNNFYKQFKTTTASECFQSCDEDSLCDASSFSKDFGCFFFQNEDFTVISKSNWTTYFKQPSEMSIQNDYRSSQIDKNFNVTTPYECYYECKSNSLCVGFNILWSYEAHISNFIQCSIYYYSENSTLTSAVNWINYDVNECLNNPCQNRGVCVNVVGTYNCRCTINYTGKNCSIVKPRISTTKRITTATTTSTKTTTTSTTKRTTTTTTTKLITTIKTTSSPWVCGIQNSLSPMLKIIGGIDSKPHSWPWQVYLYIDNMYQCGASLINQNWLVTSAHCIQGARVAVAFLGKQNLNIYESVSVMIIASKMIPHENFTENFDNDIGLVKLAQPVSFKNEISPICIPEQGNNLASIGSYGYITGWGTIDTNVYSSSNILQEAIIPIKSSGECGYLTDNMICAGSTIPKIDSCYGDSGGPLAIKYGGAYYLSGITSSGVGCEGNGVYTKVSNYVNWIKNKIALN